MSNTDDNTKKLVDAEVRELEAELERLRAKRDKMEATAAIRIDEALDDAKSKRDAARQRLEELSNRGSEAASEVGKGLEAAVGELRSAVDRARKKFSGD